MLYLGTVAGIVAANPASRRAGLDPLGVWIALLLLVPCGLAGARLTHVATHWWLYRERPDRLWRRSEGGAAMLGGLPVALAVSVPLLSALDVPLAEFWDVATLTVLIAMVFTRVGCLLNGCCSGRPSDAWFAVRLPDHRGVWRRRIPMQALEGGIALLLLAAAVGLSSRRPFAGALFLVTVAAYSLGRVLLEPLRAEPERIAGRSVQRALAAVLGILAGGGLLGAWWSAG